MAKEKMISRLQERAKQFSILLPFMEGKEKGDMERLHDGNWTINDYGFLIDSSDGSDKKYVCFTVKEDPQHFYFGGKVLTDQLQQLEDEGFHEDIINEGLPVAFETKKSKNKDAKTGLFLKYTSVIFYPEA